MLINTVFCDLTVFLFNNVSQMHGLYSVKWENTETVLPTLKLQSV